MGAKHNLADLGSAVSRWTTPQLEEPVPAPQESGPSLEELRQRAREQGFAEGHAEGLRQGQAQLDARARQLELLLDALAQPFADLNQQLLQLMAGLSGKIARSLVKRELRSAPETIMALVRDTTALLDATAPRLNVYLNPADARVIAALMQDGSERTRWALIEDPSIAPGDCKVGNLDSIVDGNLTARIDAVLTQFQGDERG
ncbi:MAG TPA: FliH/SctL family protein [Hyphomicrobiales bacterium]|nr:FliH/SctL family protein [Hyphomicrobiales bacterium]